MKKTNSRATHEPDDMRPEYDFRGAVRGKHATAYGKGHTVKMHRQDHTIVEQHFTLEEGAVFLEPDVRAYFPDSESVNAALRALITLIPAKRTRRKAAVNEK